MPDSDYQIIHAPNGDILHFPADMSDDDIRNVMVTYGPHGLQVPQAPLPPKDLLAGTLKEAARGVPIAGPALAENAPAAVEAAAGYGDYQGNLAASKQKSAEFQQHYPTESTGLNIAGGVAGTLPMMAAVPAAFGATGAGTLANIAGGTFGGGVVGGADAYMRGQNPWVGAVGGAVTGGTVPAVARGIGAAAGGAVNAFRPVAPELQGIDPKALDWAVKLARADGLGEQEIAAQYQQLGPHGFLAEYGPNLKEATGFVAARPGTGKTDIYGSMEDRALASRQRVEDAVTQVAGPRQNMADVMAQSKEAQAQTSNPLYERWRNTMVPLTPEMQALIPRLQAAGAFQSAEKKMAIAGMPKAQGTAEWWDYVKRALGDGIERAQGRAPDDVRLLTKLQNDLVGSIDNHPDQNVAGIWKHARETWGDAEGIMKARAGGQNIFDPRVRSDELAYKLQDYSNPEYQAHQEGVRDAIATLMDHSTRGVNEELRASAFNRLMTPEGQNKLVMTYGQDGANQLISTLKQEMGFANMYSDTLKNSKTAARSAVGEMMTPDPKTTLTSRFRETYSPHVTPGVLLPPVFEHAAATRQAQQFEQARNALAPILLNQGNDAQTMARLLMEYGKRSDLGNNVRDTVNFLLQSAAPFGRQEVQKRLQ